MPLEGLDFAFQSDPERVDLPRRKQGEAISYGIDGASLYVTTEGDAPPIDFISCSNGEAGESPIVDLTQICSLSAE